MCASVGLFLFNYLLVSHVHLRQTLFTICGVMRCGSSYCAILISAQILRFAAIFAIFVAPVCSAFVFMKC